MQTWSSSGERDLYFAEAVFITVWLSPGAAPDLVSSSITIQAVSGLRVGAESATFLSSLIFCLVCCSGVRTFFLTTLAFFFTTFLATFFLGAFFAGAFGALFSLDLGFGPELEAAFARGFLVWVVLLAVTYCLARGTKLAWNAFSAFWERSSRWRCQPLWRTRFVDEAFAPAPTLRIAARPMVDSIMFGGNRRFALCEMGYGLNWSGECCWGSLSRVGALKWSQPLPF